MKSESNAVPNKYIEITKNIEKLSQVMHFIMYKTTITVICLAAAMVTAINYFIYDYGNDSYYLPLDMM